MKIPRNYNFITNEVYWLSQNKKFQRDLTALRNKYKISMGKICDLRTYFRWSDKFSIEKHLEFENDFLTLAKRCVAYSSRHSADFVNTLRMFVLANKLGVIHNKPNKPSHAIPLITTTANENKVEIKIIIRHFDTGIEEIVAELRKCWKNEIKPFQIKLSKRQILKEGINFRTNTQIWEMYQQGKSATQISEKLENTEYTQQNISDILRTASDKIRRAYN